GWAIGDREPYSPERDEAHAAAMYSILEDEIVPLFYEHREQGVPVEWMRRVRRSLQAVSAEFNCQRMVTEYREQLYKPAHAGYVEASRSGFAAPREKVVWARKVAARWQDVRIQESSSGTS